MSDYSFDSLIEKYNLQRAERFAYIDFRLQYMGTINRSDLSKLFGIAEAAASKEVSEYKKLRPENVVYDRVLRANSLKRDLFNPLIQMDAETALGMLANGFNKNKISGEPLINYQRIGLLPHKLDTDIVSKITRSIHGQTAITCRYISGNSTNHDYRTLLPTAIFFDGQSWKFRAYDRALSPAQSKFKCFNFSRVNSVEELPLDKAKITETIARDGEWNLLIPIHLGIHPELTNSMRMGIRQDFGMEREQDEFITSERAALVWFLFKQWNVDTNDQASKDKSYSFHLKNSDTLKHVDSIKSIFEK